MKKNIITVILCLLLILTAFPAFSTAAQEDETISSTAHTQLKPSNEIIKWKVEFDFSVFEGNPEEYDHTLARMSLGMAASSFRNNDNPEHRDEWIIQYLDEAGFENITTEWYDKDTTEHSISTAIALKELGDKTVIAAVPCGGNYENEWLSNFNVGDEVRHVGFAEAAELVKERIMKYISDNDLTGDLILWMSGYSRGGAVANLVEADMTSSGMFTKVFGYNYAVPHNTRDYEEQIYYNIFNILGKFDIVPLIPFLEWGYGRYGLNLYTPAQEMDSNYDELFSNASIVSEMLTGREMVNNPGVNSQLHMLMEYLYQMLPTSEDYENVMKEPIRKAFSEGDISDVLNVFISALNNVDGADSAQMATIDSMLDYLETIVGTYLQGNKSDAGKGHWDKNVGLAMNLIREHNPDAYINWMFSSNDPEVMFTDSIVTGKIIISGNVEIDIYGESEYVESVRSDGYTYIKDELFTGDLAVPSIYALKKGQQLIIMLPPDRDYSIVINSLETGSVGYMGTIYMVENIIGYMLPVVDFEAEAGGKYYLYYIEDETDERGFRLELKDGTGEDVKHSEFNVVYSPELINRFENFDVYHLTIADALMIAIGIILFVALLFAVDLIIAIVHGIKCRKRGKPYSKYYIIVPHLLLALMFFIMTEFSCYSIPAIRIVPPLMASLGMLILTLVALRGNMRRNCMRNTVILILCAAATVAVYITFRITKLGVFGIPQLIILFIIYLAAAIGAVYTFPHDAKVKLRNCSN
ncbi:MAG: hypothetical protein HUJ76_07255 [Parasporobacterium sp.]|nr:hypothetical protein [Parasporobacterium sp.]